MEKYLKDCQAKKDNVKTSSWWRSQELKKKEEVQDIVDTILNISYPYISESNGLWTNMRTKIMSTEPTVSISVKPEYLPMGSEDQTRVAIGVVTDKKEMLHMNVWRTEDKVFTSAPFIQAHKIHSLTDLMTIKIPLRGVNLTSSGGASKYKGGCLGQYCYDPDTDCYVQSNTEAGHEKYRPRYIYPVDDVWYVGDKPGEKGGYMKNPTKSHSLPPLDGWMYADKDNTWAADTTLVISPAPLTLCDSLTVSASGPAASALCSQPSWGSSPELTCGGMANLCSEIARACSRVARDGMWGRN